MVNSTVIKDTHLLQQFFRPTFPDAEEECDQRPAQFSRQKAFEFSMPNLPCTALVPCLYMNYLCRPMFAPSMLLKNQLVETKVGTAASDSQNTLLSTDIEMTASFCRQFSGPLLPR